MGYVRGTAVLFAAIWTRAAHPFGSTFWTGWTTRSGWSAAVFVFSFGTGTNCLGGRSRHGGRRRGRDSYGNTRAGLTTCGSSRCLRGRHRTRNGVQGS